MYNKFYGFSEKPFELLPDPKFLFLTPSHREALDSMIGGIKNRRGFISITGELGTGKTTLIRYLLGRLEVEEKVKSVLIFHPTITFKELLEHILLELDLEVVNTDKRALLHQLNAYLIQMDLWDETLIVIIDEAQDLPNEVMGELGMLPKLAALQIVFIGQPEFEDKLNSQGLGQLKQRIGIKRQIRVLSESESEDYIDHRLRLVRSSRSDRFTPKAISLICSHAQGIPRLINLLCDNALLLGYSLSQKKIDVDIIREVIKDMQRPFLQKPFLSPIIRPVKEFRLPPLRLNFLRSKTFVIVLSFLCLGGLVLLINRLFQPRPTKTWEIKSIKTPSVDTKPSLTTPSAQKLMKEISKSNTHHPSDKSELVSPESPKPVSLPPSPLSLMKEEDKLMEIVTIKKGYTISYLTEKYYGMVNRTLIDFILDLNPEIIDVNLISVGQKIKIPKITKGLLTIQSTDHTYNIRVGTFQNLDFVRFYSNEPTLKGKAVKFFPRKVSPQETWYRVVVGPFGHKEECLRVIDQLKEKGLLPVFFGGDSQNKMIW